MRATLSHDKPIAPDAGALRQRFAAGKPVAMLYGDQGIDAERAAARRRASVLVPIVTRPGELTLLLTRRTAHLKNHSSQIAFPGGGVEPGDASAEATALRETREEIGLDPARVRLIGRLDTYVVRTGFRVHPFVGLVRAPLTPVLDRNEVEEAFEVPLGFFLRPGAKERHSRMYRGQERHFFAYPYENYYIWGATAGMLGNLAEILNPELLD